jgi:hypothetical protein
MSKKKPRIPHKFLPWIDARKKFCLSHRHIQMARELGMNPKRFNNMANTENKPWKLPLPKYIESLYEERFEKESPDVILSIEQIAAQHTARREAKKAVKEAANAVEDVSADSESLADDSPD